MPCSFLELPTELRLVIYDYAGCPGTQSGHLHHVSNTTPALLHTHPQIRQDLLKIFYSSRIIYGDVQELEAWLRANPARTRHVQTIQLSCSMDHHNEMALVKRKAVSAEIPSMAWEVDTRYENHDYSWYLAARPGGCVLSAGARAAVRNITEELKAVEKSGGLSPTDDDYLAAVLQYLRVLQEDEGQNDRHYPDSCEICNNRW